MHAANLDRSERLQRILKVLRHAHRPISTLEIIKQAKVCAVSAAVSELREQGHDIVCRIRTTPGGRIWVYHLEQA